jgi:hypothetical protein
VAGAATDAFQDNGAGKAPASIVGVGGYRFDVGDFVDGFIPHATIGYEIAVWSYGYDIQVLSKVGGRIA